MKKSGSMMLGSVMASLALFSSSAFAHAVLKSTVPQADAKLAKAPAELALTFNERLEGAFSGIQLTDGAGTPVKTGKAEVDPANPARLKLGLPDLAPGTYTVNWSAVGSDGHRRKGTYRFTVGQ